MVPNPKITLLICNMIIGINQNKISIYFKSNDPQKSINEPY